jgi:peptidoglycan/xylan/chitin deacetylase (PgdA/CDA1 family)
MAPTGKPARQSRRLRRRLLKAVAAAGLGWLLLVAWQPAWAFRVLAWAFPRFVWRVETAQPLVALSFDDGPDPTFTPQVLDLLAAHRAQATFFLIGRRAAGELGLVARIRGEGHEVGNHYLTNGTTLTVSTQVFTERLIRTEEILGLSQARPKLFRPPGGVIWPAQIEAAQARGYVAVLGSAYPYDPRRPPAAFIRWLVSKNLAPGAIVILHDGGGDRSRTVAALPGILEAGRSKGLRFVTVGELRAAAPNP